MTRRDRAALVLAYECLRERFDDATNWSVGRAASILEVSDSLWPLVEAVEDWTPRIPSEWRLLRARLALYIRAVLRADKGDWGPLWCACGDKIDADEDPGNARLMRQCFGCQAAYRYTRGRRNQGAWSYVPLWEQGIRLNPRS